MATGTKHTLPWVPVAIKVILAFASPQMHYTKFLSQAHMHRDSDYFMITFHQSASGLSHDVAFIKGCCLQHSFATICTNRMHYFNHSQTHRSMLPRPTIALCMCLSACTPKHHRNLMKNVKTCEGTLCLLPMLRFNNNLPRNCKYAVKCSECDSGEHAPVRYPNTHESNTPNVYIRAIRKDWEENKRMPPRRRSRWKIVF
ncbi:hypothetical protein CHS0354_020791 [Potamilus streckersoni]|uniref:Uncharacterized protein n=1 Tax=Potamilus streckersoni TaxID=2493646 RepID=A0AAE0VSY5_9BIVA|nr:hypothetical protein CHS0354_020791 [Potamilus streckersoni]